MMKTTLLALAAGAQAADWVVLVAGSKTYGNYRHQSDVCHAYQVVRNNGIPDSNIIVMQFDDIASSPSNPFPGQIFNKPTVAGTAGVDVYANCKKDYSGADVTPEMFVAVLTGDSSKTGGKPVLQSTGSDRVFINFVDHGGVNIIAFPDGSLMQASELNAALATMQQKKMYQKLVFYMEACESGSMFQGLLPTNMNIYVTTASNPSESSWGTYCPPDDMVNGKEIGSCLGDAYSVNWMENAEAAGSMETLQEQYDSIVKSTDKSHVMQYGDISWTSEPIGNYIGAGANTTVPLSGSSSNVRSRDIPMHLSYYKYLRAHGEDFETRMALAKELQQQLASRMQVDQLFHDLVAETGHHASLFTESPKLPTNCDVNCCEKLQTAFHENCGGFDDYSLQYNRVLVNLCVAVDHDAATADKLASTMVSMCAKNLA